MPAGTDRNARSRTRTALALATASAIALVPARAAEPASDGAAAIARELARLNQTLREIGARLDEVLRHQRIQALLARMMLAERRLAPLEDERRGLEREIEDVEQQLAESRALVERQRELIGDAELAGRYDEAQELQSELTDYEPVVASLENRLAALRQRMERLLVEAGARRDELEILTEQLDTQLDLDL